MEEAMVDKERDDRYTDEDEEVTVGDGQQDPKSSGDEQSVAEDPDIEADRKASGDRSRKEHTHESEGQGGG